MPLASPTRCTRRPARWPQLLAAWFFVSVALILARPGPAQEANHEAPIHIKVGAPGTQMVPIALPRPVGRMDATARAFYDMVRHDLEVSGWFEFIDPAAYIEPAGTGIRFGEFKWEDWDAPGAVALAKTGLAKIGEADGSHSPHLRAEVWVYDVPGRRKLGAKAFSTPLTASNPDDALRIIAHKVANEIIFAVTGQQGLFDTRFAFVNNSSGNKEIYVVDFDGERMRRITHNGSINIKPAWRPDGGAIAFTSYVSGNPDLYVADLIKGRIVRVSSRPGINTGPSWSPDGKLIALTLAPHGDPDIYTIDAATGRLVARLTHMVGIDSAPAFSPDGKRVAFVSERSGGAQIYVMNANGSNIHRVTFQGSYNTDPAWSPDGTRLAFVSRQGVFDVFTVNLDGTGLVRITQAAGDNEDPTWSPDGYYIGFSSTRTGHAQIWMSTADGSHQVQLTHGKGDFTNPDWSPRMGW